MNRQQIKPGDIVLVHDDTPRITWKLAVIEELMKGKDGLVRAAKIRTSQGRTNRPIARLIPLEVSSNVIGESTVDENNNPDKKVQTPSNDANTALPLALPPADRDQMELKGQIGRDDKQHRGVKTKSRIGSGNLAPPRKMSRTDNVIK